MPFLMVLGVLAAGIVYYVYETQKSPFPEEEVKVETETGNSLKESVRVQHPVWTDTIIPDANGRVHRQSNNDKATVSHVTDNSFTLKWDAWGVEVFEKDPQTDSYKLKEKRNN